MRPIVRILLRNGVMHRDFAELSKGVYVRVATEDYGLGGRPTNISRVALLTGLDRKEVRRVRGLLEEDEDGASGRGTQDRLTRVLSGWYQDSDFQDRSGVPLELLVDGEGSTFAALVRRYGGDVPVSAMLKELKRVGAVEETESKRLLAKQRYYMPAQAEPEAVERSGAVLHDLGVTVDHNLYRDPGAPSRFEGRATNNLIDPKAMSKFRAFIEKEGEAFLEKVDRWLSDHEIEEQEKANSKGIRLGLGLYWIQDRTSKGAKK